MNPQMLDRTHVISWFSQHKKQATRQGAALLEATLAKRARKSENAAWAVFASLPICAENS